MLSSLIKIANRSVALATENCQSESCQTKTNKCFFSNNKGKIKHKQSGEKIGEPSSQIQRSTKYRLGRRNPQEGFRGKYMTDHFLSELHINRNYYPANCDNYIRTAFLSNPFAEPITSPECHVFHTFSNSFSSQSTAHPIPSCRSERRRRPARSASSSFSILIPKAVLLHGTGLCVDVVLAILCDSHFSLSL